MKCHRRKNRRTRQLVQTPSKNEVIENHWRGEHTPQKHGKKKKRLKVCDCTYFSTAKPDKPIRFPFQLSSIICKYLQIDLRFPFIKSRSDSVKVNSVSFYAQSMKSMQCPLHQLHIPLNYPNFQMHTVKFKFHQSDFKVLFINYTTQKINGTFFFINCLTPKICFTVYEYMSLYHHIQHMFHQSDFNVLFINFTVPKWRTSR